MRSTETIEEVNERNACLDGSQVCDTGQIHRFLNGMACQHADAGLAACVNVLVVAEDVQRTGCQRTCRYVQNARQTFTDHLVDVRNHQQQTL